MNLQISVPKAGTHLFGLMTRCTTGIIGLREVPQIEPVNQFVRVETLKLRFKDLDPNLNYRGHIPYHPEIEPLVKRQFQHVLLILRDPRDVIVSWAHYVENLKTSALNTKLNRGRLSDIPFSSRVDFLIDHMRLFLLSFEPWREKSYVTTLHYEEFKTNPQRVLMQLAAMEFGSVTEMLERARKREYTFRKGTINNWQTEFNEMQKHQAEKKFGDIIAKWRSQYV